MHLHYLPEAKADILAAINYYIEQESGDKKIAAEFYQALKVAEQDILEFPNFWPIESPPYRRKVMQRFPYSIIFHQLDEATIEIAAIAHHKRQPNYWLD